MSIPLELWTNLWLPWDPMMYPLSSPWGPAESERAGLFLSAEQRQIVDAAFREASGATEGKLAIALGCSAEETATQLYVYFEPLAYLTVALDPIEKKVSVSVNFHYWSALEAQFMDVTRKAEVLLGEGRVVDALILCIREGRAWVEAMMRLGPP